MEGWEAELIEYQPWDTNKNNPHTTYHITKCPEFVRDEPRRGGNAILSLEENEEFIKGRVFPKTNAGYTIHE